MMKLFRMTKKSKFSNSDFIRFGIISKIYKESFCDKNKINTDISNPTNKENIFDEDELREISNLKDFMEFHSNNKNSISKELDKQLIFLEFYSEFIENLPKSKLNENEFVIFNKIISEEIMKMDIDNLKSNSLFILSLIESLNKLNFLFVRLESENDINLSKIWIRFEYIILRTEYLKTIHFTNFDILLKTFQNFFLTRNTTISAEEIFEAIEYELILQLKNHKGKFIPSQIEKLSEIYILFGKNLEGSLELYNLFIQKVFTVENLESISKYSNNLLTAIYLSSVLIYTHVISSSNRNFKKFLNSIEELLQKSNGKSESNFLYNKSTIEAENIANWCRMKMTTRKNRFL